MDIDYKGWSKWYDFEELFTFEGLVDPKVEKGMVTTIEGEKGSLAKWDGFLEKEDSDIYFEKGKLKSPAKIPCGIYMMRVEGDLPKIDPPKSKYYDYIGLAGGIMNSGKANGFYSRLPAHFRKLINVPERGNIRTATRAAYPDCNKGDSWKKKLAEEKPTIQIYRDFFDGHYHIESNFKKFFECNQNKLGSTKDIQDFFNSKVRIRFNFLERNLTVNREGAVIDIRYEDIYKENASNARKNIRDEVLQGNKDSLNDSKIYHSQEEKYQGRLNKAEGLCLQAYFAEYDEYPFLNDRDEVAYALEGFKEELGKG